MVFKKKCYKVISVDDIFTENIVAKGIHADGTNIEAKMKLDDLPVGKKIIERDTVKEIQLDTTKENKNGQVDELKKLRQFLSQKELSVCHLRCIIVGCTGAGKTTLLRRLGNPTFEILNSMKSTEKVDVHDYSFEVLEDDETIQSKKFRCCYLI